MLYGDLDFRCWDMGAGVWLECCYRDLIGFLSFNSQLQ
jgi:hypothetical protein